MNDLPRAWGASLAKGILRARNSDFQVLELLPFELTGEGEHLYLRIRKTGQNTRWLADQLARGCQLRPGSVGYAGLKDRHAVTEQWFSLHLPGRADPVLPDLPGVEVLEARRHQAKLRTGALAGNLFQLVLRDCVADIEAVNARLETIAEQGVPNYFGAQRFGHQGGNIDLLTQPGARRDRRRRSFGLSALRSAMFNHYLAGRVEAHTWLVRNTGEIATRAEPDAGSGLLWGIGENLSSDAAEKQDSEFFAQFPASCEILRSYQARMMRRSLRLSVQDLDWLWDDDRLTLSFALSKGSYATSVVHEIGEFDSASPGES